MSLPTANLGGLIVGMLLGLAGAALAISWSDHPLARVLLLLALTACATLGSAPQPAAAASMADQAPGPAEGDTAESCVPPSPTAL